MFTQRKRLVRMAAHFVLSSILLEMSLWRGGRRVNWTCSIFCYLVEMTSATADVESHHSPHRLNAERHQRDRSASQPTQPSPFSHAACFALEFTFFEIEVNFLSASFSSASVSSSKAATFERPSVFAKSRAEP